MGLLDLGRGPGQLLLSPDALLGLLNVSSALSGLEGEGSEERWTARATGELLLDQG